MRLLDPDRLVSRLLPLFIVVFPSQARADGGVVRLSERQANYRITVFTSPTPLRAGPVDVSVFVQDSSTGEPAADVRVTIHVARKGVPDLAFEYPATTEAATNRLFCAAKFDLPAPGWYALEVQLAGKRGEARSYLELDAADRLPPWAALWPWFTWPFAVALLFGIHQFFVQRSFPRGA